LKCWRIDCVGMGVHQPKPRWGPGSPVKIRQTGVILHQPLNLSIFRKIGQKRLFYERDSCIPPPQKRRTPLPGVPENTIFGPLFWVFWGYICSPIVQARNCHPSNPTTITITPTQCNPMRVQAYIKFKSITNVSRLRAHSYTPQPQIIILRARLGPDVEVAFLHHTLTSLPTPHTHTPLSINLSLNVCKSVFDHT